MTFQKNAIKYNYLLNIYEKIDFEETIMELAKEIGLRIRSIRKSRKMSIEDLAGIICKTKSAISKYENGLISVDIVTLYDIAEALNVDIRELLVSKSMSKEAKSSPGIPAFFRGVSQLFMYYYNGRTNRIVCSIIDIIYSEETNNAEVRMYMNVKDPEHYYPCEDTYYGTLSHYEVLSTMLLQNQNMAMDRYQIGVPTPYINEERKWVLTYGISSRPLMPTSTKHLLSKQPLPITDDLIRELKISKEDIRLLKLYNMLVVM